MIRRQLLRSDNFVRMLTIGLFLFLSIRRWHRIHANLGNHYYDSYEIELIKNKVLICQ